MDRLTTRKAAAIAAAGIAAIHLALAPEYLEEATYVGVLFILGGLAAGLVAIRLWRVDDALAWVAGALIAAGMAVGFVLSRTLGLPGFHESEWELSGLLSLLLEAAFLVAAAVWKRVPRRVPVADGRP
jgi:peptidoglycan/LPS O-acetylase OafA/YrhL